MTALIPLFLANLPALIKAGGELVQYVKDFRTAAQQSGEWSEDHEIEFQATLQNCGGLPEWQTDEQRGQSTAS